MILVVGVVFVFGGSLWVVVGFVVCFARFVLASPVCVLYVFCW